MAVYWDLEACCLSHSVSPVKPASSPRKPARLFCDPCDGMLALDSCALCAKPLALDSDIFMYRGDTPFCSEECRDEQMQLDAVCARQAARRLRQYASVTEARRGHQKSTKVSVVS
jgi:hypothetical protein